MSSERYERVKVFNEKYLEEIKLVSLHHISLIEIVKYVKAHFSKKEWDDAIDTFIEAIIIDLLELKYDKVLDIKGLKKKCVVEEVE
jgi:hypothetical protein